MAKYTNAYMEAPDEDDRTYSEQVEAENKANESAANDADSTWEKRYGDLRRHSQSKEQKLIEEKRDLERQLEMATKEQIKFPKSEAEIKDWMKRYPDVTAAVETIAAMRVQDAMEKGEELYGSSIKELRNTIAKKDAETELRRRHPDFDQLKTDAKFHEWLSDQPLSLQDTIYRNSTDAMSAARTIDFYKREMDIDTPAPKAKQSNRSAADAISTSGTSPSTKGKVKFRESDVARMSVREYEKNEEAIYKAISEGNFEYDLQK